jgi:hypothetical protein
MAVWRAQEIVALDLSECRLLIDMNADTEICGIVPVANGTGAAVIAARSCGAHSCTADRWLFSNQWPRAQLETAELAEENMTVGIEMAPTHRVALVTRVRHTQEQEFAVWTDRVDLPGRNAERFTSLFSCRLDPRSEYFVCRNARGSVLRLNNDGSSTLIAEVGLNAQEIEVGGPLERFPKPVRFGKGSRLSFAIQLLEGSPTFSYEDMGRLTFDVTWSPGKPPLHLKVDSNR